MELEATPLVEIVPTVGLPFAIRSTAQFTCVLVTPAVSTFNCSDCDGVTLARRGESDSCPWIVTLAEPVVAGSACKTAVTVTVA